MGVWFANEAIDRRSKGSPRRSVSVDKDGNVKVTEIPTSQPIQTKTPRRAVDGVLNLLEGVLTWQTPVSFLAGIGVHHIYCKYWRDRKARGASLYRKKVDGTYMLSTRFWVCAIIATVIICYIGWRTQDTADRVENQSMLTRDCLTQVITALTVARTITNQNDQLSEEQRTAYAVVLEALVAPPEPY